MFSKKDLKTGMKLVTRCGREYIYFSNFEHEYNKTTNVIISKDGGWNNFENNYLDDLENYSDRDFDIVSVYSLRHAKGICSYFKSMDDNQYKLVWDRYENQKREKEISDVKKLIINLEKSLLEANNRLKEIEITQQL